MQVFSYAERPDLAARLDEVDDVFPEFIHHADVTDLHWAKLRAEFPELQVLLYDDEQDRVVGCGQTIPASTRGGLPGGARGKQAAFKDSAAKFFALSDQQRDLISQLIDAAKANDTTKNDLNAPACAA